MKYTHSDYLSKVFVKERRNEAISKMVETLKDLDFDAIAVRGVSGITMGSILAHVLNKELVVVRKLEEDSHASYNAETPKEFSKYIVVDDFTCSGETLFYVVLATACVNPNATCRGFYSYNSENPGLMDSAGVLKKLRHYCFHYSGIQEKLEIYLNRYVTRSWNARRGDYDVSATREQVLAACPFFSPEKRPSDGVVI